MSDEDVLFYWTIISAGWENEDSRSSLLSSSVGVLLEHIIEFYVLLEHIIEYYVPWVFICFWVDGEIQAG